MDFKLTNKNIKNMTNVAKALKWWDKLSDFDKNTLSRKYFYIPDEKDLSSDEVLTIFIDESKADKVAIPPPVPDEAPKEWEEQATKDYENGYESETSAIDKFVFADEAGEVYVWVSKITEIDKANFWSKAKQMGYCWEWQNNKDSNGYGMVKIQGLYTKASRVAYQIINGAILDGLHVLHKCDNPGCINPDHLFTGTHQDNMNDKTRKGRGKTLGKGSKYMGVVFRSDSKKWRAYISQNGKHIRLGCFATEEEAAKRRDEEVIKLNLNLKLNF